MLLTGSRLPRSFGWWQDSNTVQNCAAKVVPKPLLQISVAQLHDHAGGSDAVDGVQHLLQLFQGDWMLLQVLMQALDLLFHFLHTQQLTTMRQ